jgi:hypothetical protein
MTVELIVIMLILRCRKDTHGKGKRVATYLRLVTDRWLGDAGFSFDEDHGTRWNDVFDDPQNVSRTAHGNHSHAS